MLKYSSDTIAIFSYTTANGGLAIGGGGGYISIILSNSGQYPKDYSDTPGIQAKNPSRPKIRDSVNLNLVSYAKFEQNPCLQDVTIFFHECTQVTATL